MKTLLSEMLPFKACRMDQNKIKDECYSAFVGAILVIPQAITFAYVAGVPVEFGLYSAIFVTFIAAMFGCSPMVGGPNTTSAILISSAILPLAGRGSSLYIEYVLLLTLMVGVIQFIVWLLRGGQYFQYFSPVVFMAITTGVGSLIMLSALDGITGINTASVDFFYQRLYLLFWGWDDLTNRYTLIIGGTTLIVGWISKRSFPRAFLIIALSVGYLVSYFLHLIISPLETQIEFIGDLPFTLLPFSLPTINKSMMLNLFDSALIIALIGLAQSMVIIKDIKIQKRQVINNEKEVFAQAVSNIIGSFFSSFAGAGSFNRTSIALGVGATTPIAAMLSSILVVLIILLLQPLLLVMPMPTFSAILFLVGVGMIKVKKISGCLRSRQNKVLFWLTYLTVMFIGLKAGIGIAILLSVLNFLLHANRLEITDTHPADYQVITIHGNFFYASIDQLLPHFEKRDSHLILNLDFVAYFDDSAAEYIQQEYAIRSSMGYHLLIVAPFARHKDLLQRSGGTKLAEIFDNFAKARTALEVINVSRYLNSQRKKL